MSKVRTIAKNTLLLTIAEGIDKLLGLILVIFEARYLGDVGYGKYSFAIAFTSFLAIIADPGLSILTTRDIAREKELVGKYLGNISLIKFALSVIAFFLVVIVINVMHYSIDTTLAVYIAGAYTIVISFNDFFISIFRAFEKMEYEALVRVIRQTVSFFLIMSLLYLGYGLIEIVSALLLASIFCLIFSGLIILKKFPKPKFEREAFFLRNVTKEALPFAVTAIFTIIYFRINTVLLSMMEGDAIAGWYNAAYSILIGLMIIPAIYGTAIFPTMSKYFTPSKNSFDKIGILSFKYLFMIGMPMSIVVMLLAEKIIQITYGSTYIHSAIALQLLVWAFFIMCVCTIPTISLNCANMQHIVTAGMGITAVMNIIFDLVLIQKYGLVGAGMATIIVCFFEFFFEFYYMNKYVVKINLINGDFIKIVFSSIVIGLFIIYFQENIFLTIILATFIYGLLIISLRVLSKEDLMIFREMFSGSGAK